ncbi:hypothetical protein [Pseudoclavibacter helvolus]|uniref:Uncharacterized protein n=1 Tax=Pseudoclavibacter helvolus TaxID=255205 RepID=A0A7W4UMW2_9MICO|nr:hypothetical protein [Pseudoclavibacter helvolus]MBB2956787.1 hypothetical protein [Pseudoclavibacter helvolus]
MSQDTAIAEGPEGRPIEVPASYLTDLPQFFKPFEGEPAEHQRNADALDATDTVLDAGRHALSAAEPNASVDSTPVEPEDEPPVRPDTER